MIYRFTDVSINVWINVSINLLIQSAATGQEKRQKNGKPNRADPFFVEEVSDLVLK